jgi:hypothetical protein
MDHGAGAQGGARRVFVSSVLLAVTACGPARQASSGDPDSPPVFGEGGSDAGGSAALPAASSGGAYPGNPRCAGVAAGSELIIDDFEDADLAIRVEPGRSGNWGVSHDASAGTLAPDPFAPVVGGADGTDFALHVAAEGFTESGVSLAMSLQFVAEGVRCPYDASAYRGIGLWVRGAGLVRFAVQTVGVYGSEFGGMCREEKEVCWDAHRKAVALSPEWTYKEIEWGSLSQMGWGKSVRFDSRALMGFLFMASPAELPLELWLDEIRFLPKEPDDGG